MDDIISQHDVVRYACVILAHMDPSAETTTEGHDDEITAGGDDAQESTEGAAIPKYDDEITAGEGDIEEDMSSQKATTGVNAVELRSRNAKDEATKTEDKVKVFVEKAVTAATADTSVGPSMTAITTEVCDILDKSATKNSSKTFPDTP